MRSRLPSEALVDLCSEIADGMIVVVGPDGTVEHANAAACEIFGLDPDSIRGRRFLDTLVPDSSRAEREAIQRVMADEEKRARLESRLVTSTGEERIVRWRWTLLGDRRTRAKRAVPSPGDEARLVGWGTDVTERRRAREEFLERSALARLGEMAAVVAHEVRNPLAGIRGAVEVLGDRLPDAGEGRAIVTEILSRLQALEHLVDEMLVFARPRPLSCEAVRIRPLIEEVQRLVRGDQSLAHVQIDVSGPDATIVADPVLLRRLFMNVLLNAAQASPPVGSVRIVVDVGAAGCVVTVSDEGPGVPEELREKIFEPFFTTRHGGSGLGLPIARRAAQLHGGQITLRCPPSGGTTIEIRLPSQPPAS